MERKKKESENLRITLDIIWSEEQKEHKNNEQSFRDPSESKRQTKIGILVVSEEEEEKEQKEYLKTKNLLNLMKKINLYK